MNRLSLGGLCQVKFFQWILSLRCVIAFPQLRCILCAPGMSSFDLKAVTERYVEYTISVEEGSFLCISKKNYADSNSCCSGRYCAQPDPIFPLLQIFFRCRCLQYQIHGNCAYSGLLVHRVEFFLFACSILWNRAISRARDHRNRSGRWMSFSIVAVMTKITKYIFAIKVYFK